MTDIEVGRFGVRTFRVARDGHLIPLTSGNRYDWQHGVCVAECKAGATHPPPVEGCSCGIYSFDSLEDLRAQFREARQLVAVIAPEGAAFIGANGTVCARARVIAIWTADPDQAAAICAATNPDITPYTDLDAMLSDYRIRYTRNTMAEERTVPPRTAIRAATTEARSLFGIGWQPVLSAIYCAAVLRIIVSSTADNPPTSEPAASMVALLQALDQVLLVANAEATLFVAMLLVLGLGAAAMRSMIFLWRGTQPGAASRLFRHTTTSLLRLVIRPLIFVAIYSCLSGALPSGSAMGWIAITLTLSSWASGGVIFHLVAASRARLRSYREATRPATFERLES